MSYIDACKVGQNVLVSERTGVGRRVRRYDAPYFFYSTDPDGKHLSMYGDRVQRHDFSDRDSMMEERDRLRMEGTETFESDIRTEYKLLEEKYSGKPAPQLNVAVIDIEVFSRAAKGWAGFDNPYAEITAISVGRLWIGDTVTLALTPPTMTYEAACSLVADIPDTLVFDNERDLLLAFLDLIEDADVTTGWNSEKFDMPYIVARLRIAVCGERVDAVIDKNRPVPEATDAVLKRLCVFLRPRRGEVEEYGTISTVFSFPGRPHLDYLKLYRKFILEPRESYKLDNILWVELKQRKVKYDGTLEDLYTTDFKLYVEYNRQDVNGLAGIDDKLGLIAIANEMSHQSCVLLSDAVGSVSKIEQAIVHDIHRNGMVACDKPTIDEGKEKVAGALVLDPKPGLYDWCCNLDVKSEYPSTIMMLNISPETFVGQFDTAATRAAVKASKTAWRNFTGTLEYHEIVDGEDMGDFARDMTLIMRDGTRVVKSSDEWRRFFKEGGYALTANATVFAVDRDGFIPSLLRRWFAERKEYQAKAKQHKRELEDFLSKIPVIEDSSDDEVELDDEEEAVE